MAPLNKSPRFTLLLSLSVVALALVVGIGFEKGLIRRSTSTLSQSSFEKLRELNTEHAMTLSMIAADEKPLVAEIMATNSFFTVSNNENQGLIVTLDDVLFGDGYLLVEPSEEKSEKELLKIAKDYKSAIPEFEDVEIDQFVELEGEPSYIPDIPAFDGSIELSSEETVHPVVVAVVDSGVDVKHEIFEDRDLWKQYNAVNNNDDDEVGHGTHIAGIIAQNSPNAVIAPYKIVSKDGGRLSHVLEAISEAIDDNVDVINTSFGLKKSSTALEKMLDEATEEQIIWVAAAGNHNNSLGFYPATYDLSLAIAAVSRSGQKLSQSNYGSWVDYAALGHLVRSSIPGNEYGFKSGSSQSTAIVSAIVAEFLATQDEFPGLAGVKDYLEESGTLINEGQLKGVVRLD